MNEDKPSVVDRFVPALLVISIALAFLVGILWQKVSNIEKGGSGTVASGKTPAPSTAPLAVDNLKKYAKDLKLNTNDFNTCLDQSKTAEKVKNELSEGEKVGVRGTPAFFINGRFLGGAYPFESFKEIIDLELEGKGSSNIKTYSETLQKAYGTDANSRSFDPKPKTVEIGDAPVEGDENAPVTIVEWSDFECPFCGMFYKQTYSKIKSEYVDTGKVKMVFKQFPLTFHASAQKAAEASLCAKEQGKFWEMHNKLFDVSATN